MKDLIFNWLGMLLNYGAPMVLLVVPFWAHKRARSPEVLDENKRRGLKVLHPK